MTSANIIGLPEDGRVVEISGYTLSVEDGMHPLDLEYAAAIAAHWEIERGANPALFNGPVVLQRAITCRDGWISAIGHVSSFATFLWWRQRPMLAGASHVFGYPVIASSDGALIAVRMAAHTANAGQVYFAAGSFDLADIIDGRCDLIGNMHREVSEETGLDLSDASTDGRIFASYRMSKLALLQIFRFELTADDILARIERFIGSGHDEIDGAVAIFDPTPSAHRYNPAMLPILRWYFAAD